MIFMSRLALLILCMLAVYDSVAQSTSTEKDPKIDSLLSLYFKEPTPKTRAMISGLERSLSPVQQKKMENMETEEIIQLAFGPRFTKEDLAANIDSNYNDLSSAITFLHSLLRPGDTLTASFEICPEWPGLEGIALKYTGTHRVSGKRVHISTEMTDTDATEIEKILNSAGVTHTQLLQLKSLMRSANCISITSGYPAEITFRFSGLGRFSYLIFQEPLTTAQQTAYNDGCSYIYYKKNIVLQYGGGAAGSQCF